MVKSVFTENPKLAARMSVGHREVAKQNAASFAKLERYYRSALGGGFSGFKARVMSTVIGRSIRENYSPTAYLINTLLPPNSSNRTMDYVATIVIQ